MSTPPPFVRTPGRTGLTFRASRVNVAAGTVLGVLMLAAAGVLIARVPFQEPRALTLVYALAAACLAAGLALLAFTLWLSFARVDLTATGFRRHSLAGTDDIAWSDVVLIQLHVTAKDGAEVDPSVTIWTAGGKSYHFTENHVTRMKAFIKTLRDLTSGFDGLWEETSHVSKQRVAIALVVCGLFFMAWAPAQFQQIARAEQNAGGEPIEVNELVFLLHAIGGEWLVAVGLFVIGLACLVWGLHDLKAGNVPRAAQKPCPQPNTSRDKA